MRRPIYCAEAGRGIDDHLRATEESPDIQRRVDHVDTP